MYTSCDVRVKDEATIRPADAKRRPASAAWCPWSTDSDDDDRTTSNTLSGSRHCTTAVDTTSRGLIGGKDVHGNGISLSRGIFTGIPLEWERKRALFTIWF